MLTRTDLVAAGEVGVGGSCSRGWHNIWAIVTLPRYEALGLVCKELWKGGGGRAGGFSRSM